MTEYVQKAPLRQEDRENVVETVAESGTVSRVARVFQMLKEIRRLPTASLQFRVGLEPQQVMSTYRHFTKPHPRYKLFANKSIGAALIDLTAYANSRAWLEASGRSSRSSAAYRARKARSRGYVFCEIDKNKFVDDIHEINTSKELRQGRKMDECFLRKENRHTVFGNYRYYGVKNADGKLMAYCDLGIYGNFANMTQVLGHGDALKDGVMFLLVVDIIVRLIDEAKVHYLMYDTWYGAKPGLKSFKHKLGFVPYRVKYSLIQ